MAPLAGRYASLIASICILAIAAIALWSCTTSTLRLRHVYTTSIREAFAHPTPDIASRSLGPLSDLIIQPSSPAMVGVTLASAGVEYSQVASQFMLKVVSASQKLIELANADRMVARAAFTSQYISLEPSDRSLLKSSDSGKIDVYKTDDGLSNGPQYFCVKHASQDEELALSSWPGKRPLPFSFEGMQIAFDPSDLVESVKSQTFFTPEILKRKPMVGLTMIMSPDATDSLVVFRRFREDAGFILFGVTVTDDSVTVRHIVFERDKKPRDMQNAVKALAWNDVGEYDDAEPFHAVPGGLQTIASAEAMGADEVRRNMSVATSVTLPMLRRHGLIVELTPGAVRATTLPTDTNVTSRVVRVKQMMSSPLHTWSAEAAKPLQMLAQNCMAMPVPTGDHIHLSHILKKVR